MSGPASIVQFPHPGGEHVPRTDAMAWNKGSHRRKFLRSHGSTVSPQGVTEFEGQLAFWGEWEPPSTIERRWSSAPELPTVLHLPCWNQPATTGTRQNTDPWVFGSSFLYSNCKQLTPGERPSALQRLARGSLILFGSARDGQFVLDTVLVVAGAVAQYRPVDGVPATSDAFNVCTVESLAAEPARYSQATFTLLRGATPQHPVNGMFSFVPCRPWIGNNSRFARPPVGLPGIINPRSSQSPSGAKETHTHGQIAAAW